MQSMMSDPAFMQMAQQGMMGGGNMAAMQEQMMQNPAMMEQLMQSPMMQQMMTQISQNPEALVQAMQSNPMLQQLAQQNPQVAAMIQNPEMLRMMCNPQMMQMAMQMRRNMNPQATGDASAPGAGGAAPFDFAQMMQALPGAGANAQPPEERYAQQLAQLELMGFIDRALNLQALAAVMGDVNGAVTYLIERGVGN